MSVRDAGAASAGGDDTTRRPPAGRFVPALRVALLPWLALHAVLGASLLVVLALEGGRFPAAGDGPGARGLFAWDGGWYRGIATSGYDGVSPEARRFFPLLPLLGRAVGWLVGDTLGLWMVASGCALLYLAAVAVLASRLLPGPDAAVRATWTAALIPGSTALVLPYTEALAGLLTVAFFLLLERRRAGPALMVGALAALARPTGILLVVPALLARALRVPGRFVAAAGPLVGTAALMMYSAASAGDWSAPWTQQTDSELRGGLLLNPLPGIWRNDSGGITPPVTLLLVAVAVWLLVRTFRTLPVAYGAWSLAVLVPSVCSVDAHSLPRYVAGIVPLVLVLSTAPSSPRAFRWLLGVSTVLSLVLTTVWVQGRVVP